MHACRKMWEWKQVNHKYRERENITICFRSGSKEKCLSYWKQHQSGTTLPTTWAFNMNTSSPSLSYNITQRTSLKMRMLSFLWYLINNHYSSFLLCFIAEETQKTDPEGRWTLNAILITEKKWGPKPNLFQISAFISVMALVFGLQYCVVHLEN